MTDPEPPAAPTGPTTYVLIHGGGSTRRFWDRVAPLLAEGDPTAMVIAVDLPGRGEHPAGLATITVSDEVDAVLDDVRAAVRAAGPDGTDLPERAVGPVVVVAHSSGGLVVPGVAAGLLGDDGRSRVVSVVLVAALVPPEGGCGLDCMQVRHAEGLRAFVDALGPDDPAITLPGPPDDPEPFRTATGGAPLDDDTLAFVVDPVRLVEDTVQHYFQPVRWSTVPDDVEITYLLTRNDRPVPPSLQQQMIERLPAPRRVTAVEIDTGHLAPITHPQLIADEILLAPTTTP
ncbi:MAG TPA: alpha/beta hydrolase [Microthrixaceae bacterium]|nr:alpha/beta hydrolase [Microthrixaceae bacterium]